MDTIYDKLTAIADSIREKTGKSGSLTLDDMAYEISTIKGSADLNFEVIAYESEEALLASTPVENTIGVVTTTPITSWSFSATAPTNPVDGIVWIFSKANGNTAGFNALKKNSIQIYPIYAKQYVDDKFDTKDAFIYQNEEWKSWWDGMLYEAGNLCEDYTGGWSSEGYTHPNGVVSGTIDTNGIHLTGDPNKIVMVGTKEPVDLTGYTKLKVKGTVSSSLYNISIEVFLCPTQYIPDQVAEFHLNSTTGQREEEFDIKNFDGKYYIICAAGMSAKCVGTFSYLQLL